ncbi:hypothetical protein F4604DRAFT_190308 [Suillus subluteus]|nr:hypothetical protein F4604DRAFT_190308 [Suillus subluteus]
MPDQRRHIINLFLNKARSKGVVFIRAHELCQYCRLNAECQKFIVGERVVVVTIARSNSLRGTDPSLGLKQVSSLTWTSDGKKAHIRVNLNLDQNVRYSRLAGSRPAPFPRLETTACLRVHQIIQRVYGTSTQTSDPSNINKMCTAWPFPLTESC